jgi:hypothetical protein
MKQLMIVLLAAGGLVACGGVDRDGTRDNIVDGLEDAGIVVDSACVDEVLDQYSDDELEAIDKSLESEESSTDSAELVEKILACVPATT